MLLLELFDKKPEKGGVVQDLRDQMLDMLMPLATQGVPFVTIQAIVDKMKELNSGVSVDRALVMHVLDPAEVKMVSKIEGDRVYFGLDNDQNKAGEKEEEKNANKVNDMAVSQAKNNLKKQNGVTPEPAAPSAAPAPAPNQNAGGGPL
jgi:hypothetical protein